MALVLSTYAKPSLRSVTKPLLVRSMGRSVDAAAAVVEEAVEKRATWVWSHGSCKGVGERAWQGRG